MKKNNKTILTIGVAIVFALSSLAMIPLSNNNTVEKETIYVAWNIGGETSQYRRYEVAENSTILYVIKDIFGQVSLDGNKINCIVNICNNFFTKNNWQVFLNGEEATDLNQYVKEGDMLFFYYGKPIELFNATVWIDYGGISYNKSIKVWKGTKISDLLHQFNATFDVNGTLICLFGECNNENNSWTILLNNNSADIEQAIEKGDSIMFVYK